MALPCGFSVLHWHGVSLSRSRVLGCRVGFWAIFFSSRAGNVVQVEIFNDRLSFLIYLLLGTKTVVFTRVLAIWQRKMLQITLLARSFYTDAFTLRSFYAQKLLHREVINYTESFYTQTRLHTEAFTQRSLDTGVFTHKGVYTQRLYTQTLLHKEVFTQRDLTHRRVYRQKLLRKEVFTQRAFTRRNFFTQKSLRIHEYVQKNTRNMFLKQQVLIQ